MPSSAEFAIASFGIALGNSLSPEALKKTKRSTAFSLHAAMKLPITLDFGLIDSLSDFGLNGRASRDTLGSFILRVLSLSEFNWKWAIFFFRPCSTFEPTFPPSEDSLSAQLHRIGSDLYLSSDIMDALPFSSAPTPSAFLPSSGADDVNIPFFAGVIMLWALHCRVAGADVPSLLPKDSMSSSSSSGSTLTPSAALRPPLGSSSASAPAQSGSPSGFVSSLASPPSDPPIDSSVVSLLLSKFSSLASQVESLACTLAAVQNSNLSSLPLSSSSPLLRPSRYCHYPFLCSVLSSWLLIDLSFLSDSPGHSPGIPGFRSPGLSLSSVPLWLSLLQQLNLDAASRHLPF